VTETCQEGDRIANAGEIMIHPDLVELVRCPKCRGRLALEAAGQALDCQSCGLRYPIVDDIPQLLAEEAKPVAP
jgi:uncharacterized protein YbaR (Trm112 family)